VILRGLIRLVSLVALAVAGWWLARRLRPARARRQPGRSTVPASEGSMVRDRVCNTFLPRSRALETRVDDDTHYFCSETCRRRFLEESGAVKTA
jgi:YHS domain-containing protein